MTIIATARELTVRDDRASLPRVLRGGGITLDMLRALVRQAETAGFAGSATVLSTHYSIEDTPRAVLSLTVREG